MVKWCGTWLFGQDGAHVSTWKEAYDMNMRHIKEKYSWLKHLDFMVLDVCALLISFVLAYVLKFGDLGFLHSQEWRTIATLACLLDILVILFTTPFSGVVRRYGSEEFLSTAVQAVHNLVLLTIILYMLKLGATYSRVVIFSMYGIYAPLSLLFRQLWKKLLRSGKVTNYTYAPKTIFVIGTRAEMPQLLRSINSGFFREYSVKGICLVDGVPGETVTAQIDETDSRGRLVQTRMTFQNSARLENVAAFILANRIDELYVGVRPSLVDAKTYSVLLDNGKGIHLGILPMVGFETEHQFITTVGTYKALGIGIHSFSGKQLVYISVKRLIDIVFGLIGFLCLLPLTLAVKIFCLLTGDTKSIFYTQIRTGLDGKPFKMVKFRSMVSNAEDALQELLKDPKYQKEWRDNQKLENDPRITKIGRFLRKTSLDEFPQFLNVLKGDMSIVGPRPLVPGELESHNGLQLYNQVKPGITGWWGCNGRSNTTYEERLELEYYYVKNCSLWLDALTIIKTIVVIFKRDGAV